MEAITVETARLRGLETGWIQAGSPGHPILLFLHGYPDSPDVWEFQAEHFRGEFQVICPFGRGILPSEKARSLSRYGTQSTALDCLQILRIVDPKGTRPVAVVGHDLGAVHASALAPLLGKRLSALVIINGLSLAQFSRRLKNLPQLRRSWYIALTLVPKLAEFLARRYPARLLSVEESLGGLPARRRQAAMGMVDVLANPVNQYRAFLREMPRAKREKGRRLKAPVLVLWGSRDPFLIPPTLEEWEPFAEDVTLRILEGSHWIYREKAADVNRLLSEFFAQKGGLRCALTS